MDLHQQPQEQPLNIDSNGHLLTHSETNYYDEQFDHRNHQENSQNMIVNMGQPSNNSDVMSVHTVLSQQHSVDSSTINLPHSSASATNSTTNNVENSSANVSNASTPTASSSNHLIHSNVISSTDQKHTDPQLPISNSMLTPGTINGLYDNDGLVLQNDSIFHMNSSATNINLNQPPTFSYTEGQMHQESRMQDKMDAHIHTDAQAHTHTQAQPEVYSRGQAPIRQSHMMNNQPNHTHPVVPSQRTLNKPHAIITQNQYTTEEEQERVAAAAQHVMAQQMAQQYAMLQHMTSSDNSLKTLSPQHQSIVPSAEDMMHSPASSQDTHHVVLSQMPILSPSAPSPSSINGMHQIKGDISLHNAVVHQQYQKNQENMSEPAQAKKRPATDQQLERKKSRRHTVSDSNLAALRIGTNNLSKLPSSSPRSAIIPTRRDELFYKTNTRETQIEQQKRLNETIDTLPSASLQDIGVPLPIPDINAKKYDTLSRAQLISRLILLENEKLQNEGNQNEMLYTSLTNEDSNSMLSVSNQGLTLDENKIIMEEDKNEDEESEMVEEQLKRQRKQCKWKECQKEFDQLQELIAHINNAHIGCGKPSYFCEWENCQRNEKPFTKRHKMYNHLRTHTGERPFICEEEGCGKKFSRPDSLSTHIKTHSNIRPYICRAKDCGKAYYHARSLKKHEKSHEPTALMTHIQFSAANAGPSFNAMPFGNNMPGQMEYLNNQLQTQSVMHSQSLPSSPHHSMTHQNIGHLQSLSPINNPYTPPSNFLSFSQVGMVEQQQQNNLMTQQQLLDSVNQQHNYSHNV